MSFPPPALDPAFVLATETIPRGTFHRIYWASQSPTARSTSGRSRFDCPKFPASSTPFGVLYLADDLTTCWLETVVRHNVVRPAGAVIPIPAATMTDRWACEISMSDPLVLARFADESLIDLGECVSNVMGDSYLRTQAWSALLHAHANPQVDGLRFRSRFRSDRFCVALFDRAVDTRRPMVVNERSVDPATSAESQSIMRRYRIVPV